MARPMDRNDAGAPGDWYVDTNCIACDASRHVAPGLIGSDESGRSIFLRQPDGDEDLVAAYRALLVCPTRSVGNEEIRRPYPRAFPQALGDDAFRLGHNARSSFGAHSYLVRRAAGNVMVDSPRWTRQVVGPLDEMGGVAHILLTHRDDVADVARYAERFGAQVWIHEADSAAAPDAGQLLTGTEPTYIRDDIVAFPVPGHTEGSVLFLVDGHLLFSGDSLAWSPASEHLSAFRNACWYSWDAQRDSLRRFAESGLQFDRLFCGHGWSHDLDAESFHASLVDLVARM
jgi:glyoxylase-like metal-dependent hydrolase (beta-lactamase superfamily II)